MEKRFPLFYELISILHKYDFDDDNIDINFYTNKLLNIFEFDFSNYGFSQMELFIKKYIVDSKNNFNFINYKDEHSKITFVFSHQVFRIFSKKSLYNLVNQIYKFPHPNLENIILTGIRGQKYFYISKKYNIIKKINNIDIFKKNLNSSLQHLELLGYLHLDISLDNIVFNKNTNNYILIDYDMHKEININNNIYYHIFRDSIKKLLI